MGWSTITLVARKVGWLLGVVVGGVGILVAFESNEYNTTWARVFVAFVLFIGGMLISMACDDVFRRRHTP